MVTEVSFGEDEDDKHITTWFRTTFEVKEIPEQLLVRLQRDDGAVVYLNGQELVRDNLPEGEIQFDTLANGAGDGDKEAKFFEFTVSAAALRQGTNVLAVEVQQVGPGSSDLAFDLELATGGRAKNYPTTAQFAKQEEVLEIPPALRSQLRNQR